MSTKRKRTVGSPVRAAEAARRYRVQRQDGVILASGLERKRAEKIAELLRGQHTEMRYEIKAEVAGAEIISINEYLEKPNVRDQLSNPSAPPIDATP